jgi:hypothetical protein
MNAAPRSKPPRHCPSVRDSSPGNPAVISSEFQ